MYIAHGRLRVRGLMKEKGVGQEMLGNGSIRSVSPKLDATQMWALEQHISTTQVGRYPAGRQLLIWLFRQTDGLSLPVRLHLPPIEYGARYERAKSPVYDNFGHELFNDVNRLMTLSGPAHVYLFLMMAGSPMELFQWPGDYNSEGRRDRNLPGYTIWIGQGGLDQCDYPDEFRALEFSLEEVEAVSLRS